MIEKLDKGLLDFTVLAESPDPAKYEYVPFPDKEIWGLVIPSDDKPAKKKTIRIDDLVSLPLFCSDQSWENDIPRWAGDRMSELHLEGSFKLSYNGSMFAKEHLGYLLTFNKLIDNSENRGLVFRPLSPKLETGLYLVWKKYQTFSPIASKFLNQIKDSFL